MRVVALAGLLALLPPAFALAQAPSPPSANAPAAVAPAPQTAPAPSASPAPRRGGEITRDEYVERAKQNAERRFDQMDADHDGVLTAEERRAWRESHARHRAPAAAPASH